MDRIYEVGYDPNGNIAVFEAEIVFRTAKTFTIRPVNGVQRGKTFIVDLINGAHLAAWFSAFKVRRRTVGIHSEYDTPEEALRARFAAESEAIRLAQARIEQGRRCHGCTPPAASPLAV